MVNPTLVLLPGLDGTDVFLRPLVGELSGSLELLVVEFPEGIAGYDDLLEHVRERVAHLRAFHLLASSFSGPLAVMLAAAEPERVRSLILAASFARFPRPELRRLRFAIAWPLFLIVRAVRRIPLLFSRRQGSAWRSAKAETWSRVSARTLTKRLHWLFDVDVRDRLREYPGRVLCLAFAGDTVVPSSSAREIAALARMATHVTLPGRHLGIWSEAAGVAGEIVRFLGLSSIRRTAATEPTPHLHGGATHAA